MTVVWAKSGESSTSGGARASISWICEAYCIKISHNDVFLNIFYEKKRSALSPIDRLGIPYQGDWRKFSHFQVYITGFSGLGPIWQLYMTLVLPLAILQMIILSDSDVHLIIFGGSITIYLMSGEGSTPGGALESISRGPGFYFHFSWKKLFRSLPYDKRQLFRGVTEESEKKCRMVPPLH